MSRRLVRATVCFIATFAVLARAQQPQSGQPPVFRAAIDLVHLDVSVLDKDRHPVRDLKPSDFIVTEDGKPQTIVAFSAVDVPANPEKPAVWSSRAPADVQSNEGMDDPQGRLFVLLIDDAMLPPAASALDSTRKIAKSFIDRITPSDRVAVVFSATGRNQGFTSDRARLIAAIDSLKVGHASHLMGWDTATDTKTVGGDRAAQQIHGPIGDSDMPFRAASMETLQQVAATLISAPDRRKSLIFVSPGMGLDKLSASIPVATGGVDRMVTLKDSHRQLLGQMTELFMRMQRANVTIYSIDPCGTGGLEAYVRGAAATLPSLGLTDLNGDPISSGFDWLNPGQTVPRPEQLATHVSILTRDFLEEVASNTGGRAIVNTNAFDEGLDGIFAENSSYYLLGYQQPPGQAPGSRHAISVKVNRPDVFVRTRNGYSVPDAAKPPKPGKPLVPVSPLDTAIAGAVPSAAFPMRLAVAPFMVPGQKNPTITLTLGLIQPPVTKRTTYTVDVQVNAYTTDGKSRLVGHRDTASATLVPTGGKDRARYDLLSSIVLPPGRYELRVSAHRPLDNVQGSVYADVEVPDFTAPLAVSGVIVEAVPSGAVAPVNAFDRFLPVVPTSSREFRADQDVSVFLRLYQGGTASPKPVQVTTRLVDETDRPVVDDGHDVIAGTMFHVGGRAADYRFPLPVRSLTPGRYLLTCVASLDTRTITRTVQFTVAK